MDARGQIERAALITSEIEGSCVSNADAVQELAAAGGGITDFVTHEVLADFEFIWEVLEDKFPTSSNPPLIGLMSLAGSLVTAMAIARTRKH